MTINERNLMFEKNNIKKYEFGGSFKKVKTCPNGPNVTFLLIYILFGIFSSGAVHRSSALCLSIINLVQISAKNQRGLSVLYKIKVFMIRLGLKIVSPS